MQLLNSAKPIVIQCYLYATNTPQFNQLLSDDF